MKRILTAMSLILIAANVYAQWNTTTSPPNISFTGGKVGIGTTSPQMNLHISGNSATNAEVMIEATDNWLASLHFKSNGKTWSWSKRSNSENDAFQLYYNNGTAWQGPFINVATSGRVGIGTSNPQYPLHVVGQIQAETTNDVAFSTKSNLGVVIQQGNIGGDMVSAYNYYSIFAHNLQYNGTNWIRRNQYGTGWANVMNYFYYDVLYAPSNGNGPANTVVTPTTYMRISSNGSVGIGTTNVTDAGYKLFVETGIRTRKVVVDQATWPDYVFKPDYALPSLPDVASYIKTRQHLPDMPSADSVAKSGVDLGSNQAQLLKKIEELTLYIIDQDQRVHHQQEEITLLKRQVKTIKELQEQLNDLKARL
jgi:hypothetical protein